MHRIIFCLLFGSVVFFALNCAKTQDEADDTADSDFAAASGEVGDVAGAGGTGIGRLMESSDQGRAVCSTIDFAACDTATKTRTREFSTSGGDEDPCTRGTDDGLRVFGKSILTFSDATCAFETAAAGATVTRTLSNHYIRRGLLGRRLLVYTGEGTVAGMTIAAADLLNFAGTSYSGGATIKRGSRRTDTMTIHGIHRRGLTTSGKYTHWHTLHSATDAITVELAGSGASRTATLNGTFYIDHNRIGKTATAVMTNVVFTQGCRLPTSGQKTVTYTGVEGTEKTITITFSSDCGKASIDGGAAATIDE